MRKLNTLPSARHRLLPKCDMWKRHNYRLIASHDISLQDLPKQEHPNVFDGNSKLGDIVNCDGVLLRRERASSDGICPGCYIHSKRVVECKYKTNCGESDIFKLYIPE